MWNHHNHGAGAGSDWVGPAPPPVMRAAVLRVAVRQIWFASTASVTACDIIESPDGRPVAMSTCVLVGWLIYPRANDLGRTDGYSRPKRWRGMAG